jgi:K+-transporting ATPase KdpF subunit
MSAVEWIALILSAALTAYLVFALLRGERL